MRQNFKVENVKCGGCASTLMTKLKDHFGEIEVNLEVHPREISLEIEDEKFEDLKMALRELGYPLSNDELGLVKIASTKAKSFVSCAIGKVDIATTK